MENTTYVFIEKAKVTKAMLKASKQKKLENCRKSQDGKKVMLKWDGEAPKAFDGLKTCTHSEMKKEKAGAEWTPKGP